MSDPYGNSPSRYHLLLSRKPSHSGNIEVLIYISSIWEDKHIENHEDNQWKCLWCDVKFQGINAKKALAHVIGTKILHIKRCTASIYQAYVSRYNELQQIKSAKKGLINDYSQKWSLPHHAYMISHHKLLSQIFRVTQGVCTHQIPLQYMIHHLSAQDVAYLIRAIQRLLKNVQYFFHGRQ